MRWDNFEIKTKMIAPECEKMDVIEKLLTSFVFCRFIPSGKNLNDGHVS